MTRLQILSVDGSNLTTLKNKSKNKKPAFGLVLCIYGGLFGGEGGIRTRGGLLTLTRFPGVRLKPLIHLSSLFIVSVRSTGKLQTLFYCV
jgi:hypothetical protein